MWSPIVALLEDSSVLKVLHSGSEDFEVFQRWLSVTPAPVFDTQGPLPPWVWLCDGLSETDRNHDE